MKHILLSGWMFGYRLNVCMWRYVKSDEGCSKNKKMDRQKDGKPYFCYVYEFLGVSEIAGDCCGV